MLSLRAPPRTFSPPPWRPRGRHGGFAAPRCASAAAPAATLETAASPPASVSFPILVNGCTGKMGVSVAEAATSRGLHLVPVSFSSRENLGKTVQIGDTEIEIYGPSAREDVLSSVIDEFPDVVVVDYTAPDSVNSNAELYCNLGVPFVMGTTGGNQQLLYKSVKDSDNYALISPQMGKQVVAFLAAMETIAVQYPGAFSGYRLEVLESHQAGKLDTSGTAKAVIACFEKLGVSWDMDREIRGRASYSVGKADGLMVEVQGLIYPPTTWGARSCTECSQLFGCATYDQPRTDWLTDRMEVYVVFHEKDPLNTPTYKVPVQMVKIRDPEQQLYMVGVPEEHIEGHAFHLYHLTSPDDSVSFEFQHNVCGRSIYAEGSVDAAVFLHKKVQSMDPKRIYNMIDVLQEGDMR